MIKSSTLEMHLSEGPVKDTLVMKYLVWFEFFTSNQMSELNPECLDGKRKRFLCAMLSPCAYKIVSWLVLNLS